MEPYRTSIIIPYKNLKDITQVCLDNVGRYTKLVGSSELILIDDGSDESQRVSTDIKGVPYIVPWHNERAVGWCKAINQGAHLVSRHSEYIVIMNNDIVVTPGWLDKMVAHLKADKDLGIIGPTTNRVEGYQHIDYNQDGVDFQYADVLTGFCLVIKRELYDKLIKNDGYLLDERFGLGGQDDSDICFRAQKLGYKVGIARNAFVYHYGSATFRQEFNNDAAYSKQFAQSRVQILRDKYPNRNMNNQQQASVGAQERNVGIRSSKKRMVMIALPTLGSIRVELIPRLIHYSKNQNYNVVILPETPILQPLDHARNWWVKKFLEISNDPDDFLWFIDDDIIPPFDALDRLAGHDRDAVGATCFVMKAQDGEYFPYPVALRYNENKEFIAYFGKGLERIDGTGGGCIMVKRKVYEAMDRPYEYKYYPDGTLELVADFQFCQKLAEKNFELWYDFNCVTDHVKPISLKGINDLLIKVQNEKS